MHEVDIPKMTNRAKNLFNKSKDPKLCEFAIEVQNHLYFYGSVDEKGCFIMNQHGVLPSKEESAIVFKKFLQAEIILGDNLRHFQQCSKRPLVIFDQLSFRLNKFSEKYVVQFKEVDQYKVAISTMLQDILDGQNRLKALCLEIEKIKENKLVNAWFEEEVVSRLVQLNNEINFMLYKQVKAINNSIDVIQSLASFIKDNLSLKQKCSMNVMSLRMLLNRFTSKKIIEKNKQQLKTFEGNSHGVDVKYKGSLDLRQLGESLNNKFDVTFENDYMSYLVN